MGESDLPGQDGVVTGHIRRGVAEPMLQLDVHPHSELLYVESAPIDAEFVTDFFGLVERELH